MKIQYDNMKKVFPNRKKNYKWFFMSKAWGGKLRYLKFKHHSVTIDFRKNKTKTRGSDENN